MKVSWNDINNNTQSIIDEFEKIYKNEKKYNKSEKFLKDIFSLYSMQYNIKLDENQDFDHVFHQLYSGIKDVIDSTAQSTGTKSKKEIKVDKLFEKISEDVFKTKEIRDQLKSIDPTNSDYIEALKAGIVESMARKAEIKESKGKYEDIEKEIIGTGASNLNVKTVNEINCINNIKRIKDNFESIKKLEKELTSLRIGVNDNEIAQKESEIKDLKVKIEKSVDKIRKTGLVDDKKLDKINANDRKKSMKKMPKVEDEINQKAEKDFKDLMENLKSAKVKYPRAQFFSTMDFSDMDPTTEEGRRAIRKGYVDFEDVLKSFDREDKVYQKEVDIYKNQIIELNKEEKIMDMDLPTRDDYKNDIPSNIKAQIDVEKDGYYKDMVRAQMYGDKEYKAKYDEYLKVFKNHITTNSFGLRNDDGTDILNPDGTQKQGEYKTVDYDAIQSEIDTLANSTDPEVARKFSGKTTQDILKFLQLEAYKSKLEKSTKILAGDKFALNQYKNYEEMKKASTTEEKIEAYSKLHEEMEKDSTYLKTYHYAANDYISHKEHHKTGGKVAKTFLPLKKMSSSNTLAENAGILAHNAYAFTKWRNPFKAKSFLGGVWTAVADVGNIVTYLPRLGVKATGLAISKYRYGDDDKNPNPYNGRGDARREARVDYYREQGDGAFKARVKGWWDEISPSRREETEQILMDRQLDEIGKGLEEQYIAGVTESAVKNVEKEKAKVEQNKEIRKDMFENIVRREDVYDDINKDTENAEIDTLKNRSIQSAFLEFEGIDSKYVQKTGDRDVAKNEPRSTKYISPDIERKIENIVATAGIQNVETPKEGIWQKSENEESQPISADPIGMKARDRGINNTLTKYYALEELLLLKGQQSLIKYIANEINPTKTIVEESTVTINETKDVPFKVKFGDLKYGDRGYWDHTTTGNGVPLFEPASAKNIQALALDYTVPNNLSQDTLNKLAQMGVKPGDHISYSIADGATKAMCDATGRQYANDYIQGLFNFTDDTSIMDAIKQGFSGHGAETLEAILKDPSYTTSSTGLDFLVQSFSTSHGIEEIMKQFGSWGTGWVIDGVDQSQMADVISRALVQTIQKTYINVEVPSEIASIVDKVVDACTAAGVFSEVDDLIRRDENQNLPEREEFDDQSR